MLRGQAPLPEQTSEGLADGGRGVFPPSLERLRQDSNLLPPASKSAEGGIQGVPDRSVPSPSVRVSRGSLGLASISSATAAPSVPQGPCTDVDRMWTGMALEAFMTVREVAALLRVSTWTIYALAARQELPHVRVSNALRFRPEDVRAFLGCQG